MADPTGTPLWLTLFLQLLTIGGTHLLTRGRERTKKRDEVVKDWRQQQQSLLSECVELARDHYSNPSSLSGTQVSAARIISKLKKFRNLYSDVTTVSASDAAEGKRLYIQLNDLITGNDDFQDVSRNARPMNDPIFDLIEECEEALRRNLQKERTARTT